MMPGAHPLIAGNPASAMRAALFLIFSASTPRPEHINSKFVATCSVKLTARQKDSVHGYDGTKKRH
jgi:hypothetical protein